LVKFNNSKLLLTSTLNYRNIKPKVKITKYTRDKIRKISDELNEYNDGLEHMHREYYISCCTANTIAKISTKFNAKMAYLCINFIAYFDSR